MSYDGINILNRNVYIIHKTIIIMICWFCENGISILDRVLCKSKDVYSDRTMAVVGSAHEKCLFKYEKYGLEIFKNHMPKEQQNLYPKEITGSIKK